MNPYNATYEISGLLLVSDPFFYESSVSTRSVILTSSAISQKFREAHVDYH